jgi:uncharacterized membrane protein
MLSKLKASNIFIAFLVVINVMPVLAPLFQHWGFDFGARAIYFVYSFFCHQIHWRSLHLYDHQCAWCTRDMAIWGALLTTAILVKTYKLKGIRWWQVVPFMIPIALDGGIQTIATGVGLSQPDNIFYVATNLTRALTGSIFGIGLGAFLMPLLLSLEIDDLKAQAEIHLGNFKKKVHQLVLFFGVFVFIMLGYVAMVQLWDLTSSNYKPENWLDSNVKLPEDKDDWFTRRQNALCPVQLTTDEQQSTEELLALDCFF